MNNTTIRKLLFSIFEELLDTPSINEYLERYFNIAILHHFGIGVTIRNKYLWNNQINTKILGEYYNLKEVDEISSRITEDFLKYYYLLKCFFPN